jgi:SNF2 family DNA or RNA helicase
MPQIKYASIAQNEYGERVVKISFTYDLDMIEKVRSLDGRKYHKEDHCWSAPIYQHTLNLLMSWGFELDDRLKEYLQKVATHAQIIITESIAGLKGALYPFQNTGVAFIETNKGRALIADEMGLGKTVQALAWLQLHKNFRPAVIVVPASLKLNWKQEAERWMTDINV